MEPESRATIEDEIRACFDGSDLQAATNLALRHYGPEIFALLVALMRDEQQASEAFSSFCEDVWVGLPSFRWRCSFRTWAYTLARHASRRQRDAARRQARRNVPLSEAPEVAEVAEAVRSATLPIVRTEVKARIVELRESLPEDDQVLLMLRVDKRMDWREIAFVLGGDEASASDETARRAAARLRKRFQIVKERLRAMAIEAGVIPRDGDEAGARSDPREPGRR